MKLTEKNRQVCLITIIGLQVFSDCPFGWLSLSHAQIRLHDYKGAEKSAQKGTMQLSA